MSSVPFFLLKRRLNEIQLEDVAEHVAEHDVGDADVADDDDDDDDDFFKGASGHTVPIKTNRDDGTPLSAPPLSDDDDGDGGSNSEGDSIHGDDDTVSIMDAHRPRLDNKLLAVTLIKDAWTGRSYDYREDTQSLTVYARYHQPIVKKFFLAASIGLLGLVYFEPPTYAAWQLPPEFTMPVEAICLGLIVMRVVAMFSFLKRGSFLTDPRVIMTVAILVFTVLDMVAYIAGYAKGQADLIRWTRVLRPVLVVLAHRQVRRAVNNILRSVSQMLVVVSLLAVLIGITTLLFFVLFQFNDNDVPYFTGFAETYYELYCLLTTDVFPDVMLPYYNESGWYSLVFVLYLLGGFYFFMSVMLAIVYFNYRAYMKADIRSTVTRRVEFLDRAFHLLTDGSDRLPKSTFNALFKHLVPKASAEILNINWRLLADDGSEAIDIHRFRWIVDLLSLKVTLEMTSRNIFAKYFPQIYRSRPSQLLCKFVRHRTFKLLSAGVILLNGLFIALDIDTEVTFLVIYWVEILLKMYAFGWQTFIRSGWNRFDLIVMTAGVVVEIVSAVTNLDPRWSDFILCLRVVRLIKVVSAVPSYQRIVRTIQTILPSLYVYIVVLLLLYYVFGIIGMEIWAGEMTPDNPLLNGTQYAEQEYWRVNFDTFDSACVTLFIFMVVQAWALIVAGFEAAAGTAWVRLYFVVFHVLTNVLFINIIVALILEQFLIQYRMHDSRSKDPLLERMLKLNLQIITKENEEEIWEANENLGVEAQRYYRVVKKSSAVEMLELRMFESDLAQDDDTAEAARGSAASPQQHVVPDNVIEPSATTSSYL